VALAIAEVMIEQGWFDADFVREWTNGPFLVREDDGTLLRAEALAGGSEGFVAWDEGRGSAVRYDPADREYELPPFRLALFGSFAVAGRDGPIACRPAFDLYAVQ
jgi:anaerobic selenocysteine-containing dehydrogenase